MLSAWFRTFLWRFSIGTTSIRRWSTSLFRLRIPRRLTTISFRFPSFIKWSGSAAATPKVERWIGGRSFFGSLRAPWCAFYRRLRSIVARAIASASAWASAAPPSGSASGTTWTAHSTSAPTPASISVSTWASTWWRRTIVGFFLRRCAIAFWHGYHRSHTLARELQAISKLPPPLTPKSIGLVKGVTRMPCHGDGFQSGLSQKPPLSGHKVVTHKSWWGATGSRHKDKWNNYYQCHIWHMFSIDRDTKLASQQTISESNYARLVFDRDG